LIFQLVLAMKKFKRKSLGTFQKPRPLTSMREKLFQKKTDKVIGEIRKMRKMLYTLGHTKSYLQYFEEDSQPMKKGRDLSENYPGGSVWKTFKEAEAHAKLDPDFSVFGVDADWEKDTEPSKEKDANWNDLLFNKPLIKLEI